MVSYLCCALSLTSILAARTWLVQSFDPSWDVGTRFQPLHITAGDYVEWYLAVPFHNIYVGEQGPTLDARGIVHDCNVGTITTSFTQVSPDATIACQTYPLCSFLSGPFNCLDSVTVANTADCVTAVNTGTPQLVRVRYQFTSPGVYYAACTQNDPDEPAGTHCLTGMQVEITVTGQLQVHDGPANVFQLQQQPATWAIARYRDLTVTQGDKVRFVVDRHEHDLQHVLLASPAPAESGDCGFTVDATTVLVAQSDSVADNDALTYDWSASTAGDHLFWCSQGPVFHCQFGMHVRITVVADHDDDHDQQQG